MKKIILIFLTIATLLWNMVSYANINDWEQFTTVWSWYPVISPNWQVVVYVNWNDWRKLYKKWINEVWNWIAINYSPSRSPTISPDWQTVIYSNNNDWNRLYKKWINEIWDGGIFNTSTWSYDPRFTPDGKNVIYSNNNFYKLYIKGINEVWDGVEYTPPTVTYPDWHITIYGWYNEWWMPLPLYKKFTNESWYGVQLTSSPADYPTVSSDLSVAIYVNSYNWNYLYKRNIDLSEWEVNWNYNHYILNRMTATEGNMQQVNNSAGSTSFSNSSQVKSNFLANYSYMQSWYEAKGLTLDVVNNNVDWNNWVTFSKTDVAWGMLDWYKLSAHYPFMSYKETDNTDSSIFWRTDLNNTLFQTDTTWINVWVPAYPIRNWSWGIVAYLEFPCWNLICKDQYCSDVKKIINPTPINPINPTHIWVDTLNPTAPYCWDWIKNTIDEECDWNDWIRYDLGETCSNQCKVETSPGITPWCPSYSALGFSCNWSVPTPIFNISTPTPPGWWTGTTNTGTTVINTGSIINWTPPNWVTLPVVWDINTNTGMTDTEKTISKDVICSSIDEGFKNNKTIIVTNTMADTTFLRWLKWKDEFLKTLSGSSTEVAEKIIDKKIKTSQLNQKSNRYDLDSNWDISGIQFNLTKIPNSAIMRKLVDLAIDHSSTTMADYEQVIKDSCNNSSTITGKEVVPAWFIDVNEKGETILNLFRFNWN